MPTTDVLRFVRERGHRLISPEVLGLPAASEFAELGLTRGKPRLVDALLAGDELLARQIVFDLYLAKHPVSVICDEVLAGAFQEIGDRWACRDADVYQERRSCEICLRILFEIRNIQRLPNTTWSAIGGTIEGDPYMLPSAMVELVLRECGFRATALGTSIPVSSLIRAVEQTKPKLFWLSVAHIPEGFDFVEEFAKLSHACMAEGTALAVGGRALTGELRQRMTYSAFCDTMQHMEAFARTLNGTFPVTENNSAESVRTARTSTRTSTRQKPSGEIS